MEAGEYDLPIDTDLEDLADNNLIAPFDVDLTKCSVNRGTARYVTLSFQT